MKTIHILIAIFLLTIGTLASPNLVYAQSDSVDTLAANNIDDTFDVDDEFDAYDEPETISDPFYGYNRFMFKVNDKIYRYIFNPISDGYNFIVPNLAQEGFDNIFQNAKSSIPFFNNIFQGKFKQASVVFGRFAVNSTVGVGGVFDPAKRFLNWEKYNEDFGQTLGYYDFESGPYIILPLLGPSSGRDLIGFFGDRALNPFTWIGIYDVSPSEVFDHMSYLRRVNAYSYTQRMAYDEVMEGAIDPYTALQSAYFQLRDYKSKD